MAIYQIVIEDQYTPILLQFVTDFNINTNSNLSLEEYIQEKASQQCLETAAAYKAVEIKKTIALYIASETAIQDKVKELLNNSVTQ